MAGRKPPTHYVWLLAERSLHIAHHIESYWSVDGGPLPEPKLATWGDAEGMRRAIELLTRVKKGRRGTYPGPVFEHQLRQLVGTWDELRPWTLAAAATPWFRDAPQDAIEALTPCEWDGWQPEVRDAGIAVIEAVGSVVHAIRHDGIPDTFCGTDVATVRHASERLFALLDFVPNDLQRLLLAELEGVAMTQHELMTKLRIGSKETFNGKRGKGGMKELIERGLVVNDQRLGGYYRPDAPPD